MTAQRWWVKAFARWQARVDSVKGQIQALSLAVTAFSTFSLVLQNFGLGRYVPYLGVGLAIIGPGYAYLFFEGGVWNQVSRDRADMSGNYVAPGGRINAELWARAVGPLMTDGEFDDEDRRQMIEELDKAYQDRRDGITLDSE
jgi:hypothetical protein